jgi:DNA-binding NarL/FixJ family response regulator
MMSADNVVGERFLLALRLFRTSKRRVMEIGSKVRVLLVDDQPNVRRTLSLILQPYPNIEVVGEASDGDEAVASVGTLQVAVVVMDIKMKKMDGITATRLIKTQYPDVLVLGFSTELKDYEVNAMQQAGAFEVLRKEDIGKDLSPAIQRALTVIKSNPPDTKT